MNKSKKTTSYYKLTREEELDKIVYPYVKQYLIDNNMEIKELAKKIHMSTSNLRTLLRSNNIRPQIKTLKKIMAATNLTIPQLLQKNIKQISY